MCGLDGQLKRVQLGTPTKNAYPEILSSLLDASLSLSIAAKALLCEDSADVEEDAGLLKVDAVVLGPLGWPEGIVPGEGHADIMIILANRKPALHHAQCPKIPAPPTRTIMSICRPIAR